MLTALLQLIATVLSVTYLVLDGHFGNHNALHMARQCGLHLISKLRCDAALYFPYTGPYAGRGPRRKYGHKVDYDHLPVHYLKETTGEGHIETRLYQMHAPQGVRATIEFRHYRQGHFPTQAVPMSCCSAVTWPWRTPPSWTIMVYGFKLSLTLEMPNSTGG